MNLPALQTPIATIPETLPQPMPECQAITLLRKYEPASVRTIAHRAGVNSKALSQRMRRLENEGRVIRAGIEKGTRGGCVAIVWRVAA